MGIAGILMRLPLQGLCYVLYCQFIHQSAYILSRPAGKLAAAQKGNAFGSEIQHKEFNLNGKDGFYQHYIVIQIIQM